MNHHFWYRVLEILNILILAYFILLNSIYLAMSFFAFRSLRYYARRLRILNMADLVTTGGAQAITLLAPAFNEEENCVSSVRSLLTLKYHDFEILVINDGSQDKTLERLIEAYELVEGHRLSTGELECAPVRRVYHSKRHPNLWVIDKENGGKSDALNAGLNYCRTPLFCAIDVDSLLEPDALSRVVRPFLEDDTTVAVGGIIRIANGCTVSGGAIRSVQIPKNLLAQFQVMEYLRAFLAGRMGLNAVKGTLIISGAFGLFRRATVLQVGGYSTDTVGEDMELVVRLHRYCRENKIPYNILFVPDPVAWTECPEKVSVLARQRDRWQRGLTESLVRHRKMLFNPRYGRIGCLVYPYYFFLEMMGPLIELAGYILFVITVVIGRASSSYIIAFLILAFVLGVSLSVAAVGLEELTFQRYARFKDFSRLFMLAIIENFGYRQLTTWWRVRGMISVLGGRKGWGKMERKGFKSDPPGTYGKVPQL